MPDTPPREEGVLVRVRTEGRRVHWAALTPNPYSWEQPPPLWPDFPACGAPAVPQVADDAVVDCRRCIPHRGLPHLPRAGNPPRVVPAAQPARLRL